MSGGIHQQLQAYKIANFEGGKNTAFALHALLQNEVADLQNFHLEERGGLEKRQGYSFWKEGDTATTFPIVGLWQFRIPADNYLIRVQNGNVEQSTGPGAWTDITGAETITTTQDVRPVFATFRKTLVLTNGVDVPLKWTGTGDVTKIAQSFDATADVITKASTLVRHRESIVLGDVSTDTGGGTRFESAIWKSTAGTLDTWIDPAADDGFLQIEEGDGDSITCLLDVMGYLVVFKQHSIHRVSEFGSANVSRVQVSSSVGTPGPHTAVVVGTSIFFLDSSGRFWEYDPRGTNEDSLREISREKLGPTTFDTFLQDRFSEAFAYHDPTRNEIHWFLTESAGTETNVDYTYKIATGGFAPMRYTDNFNCVTRVLDDDNNPEMVGGTYNGEVYLIGDGSYNDDGTTFESFVTIRDVDFEQMEIHKMYRHLHLYTRIEESQDIVATQFNDFADAGQEYPITLTGGGDLLDSTFELDVSTLSGPGEKLTRQRLGGGARWTQIKISQTEDSFLKILAMLLLYVPRGVHQRDK